MRHVKWEFRGLTMPVIEGDDGVLYCTSKAICEGLGINKSTLDNIYCRHRDEFECLRPTKSDLKSFIELNKHELRIERVRANLRIWTEDDMLLIAIFSNSTTSKQFRKELIKFIKENARRNYVTVEEHNTVKARLAAIEDILVSAGFALEQNASTAGALLNQQKHTKSIRLATKNGITL